jgi:hypothetical protein
MFTRDTYCHLHFSLLKYAFTYAAHHSVSIGQTFKITLHFCLNSQSVSPHLMAGLDPLNWFIQATL